MICLGVVSIRIVFQLHPARSNRTGLDWEKIVGKTIYGGNIQESGSGKRDH
jgi:hypothetical protein